MCQQPHGLVGLPNHGRNLLHGVVHPRQRGLSLTCLLLHLLGATCRGGDMAGHIPGADRHLIDSRRHRINPLILHRQIHYDGSRGAAHIETGHLDLPHSPLQLPDQMM